MMGMRDSIPWLPTAPMVRLGMAELAVHEEEQEQEQVHKQEQEQEQVTEQKPEQQ